MDRDPRLLGDGPAQLVLAALLLGLVGFIGGLVARPVAEVADDDVVQRADGLAEVERVAEDAFEADAVAPQVGSQRDGHSGRAPGHRAAAAIGEVHLHEAVSAAGVRRRPGHPTIPCRDDPGGGRAGLDFEASTKVVHRGPQGPWVARDPVDSARAPEVRWGRKEQRPWGSILRVKSSRGGSPQHDGLEPRPDRPPDRRSGHDRTRLRPIATREAPSGPCGADSGRFSTSRTTAARAARRSGARSECRPTASKGRRPRPHRADGPGDAPPARRPRAWPGRRDAHSTGPRPRAAGAARDPGPATGRRRHRPSPVELASRSAAKREPDIVVGRFHQALPER